MPLPSGSSAKRERQFEHIKEGAQKRGASESRAKEIAARTVSKERARSGESMTASKLGQVLSTPKHFEQAAELVAEDTARSTMTCGDDLDEHLRSVRAYEEADFDEVYVGQIGSDQQGFFDCYGAEVLPRLRGTA